MPIVGFHPHQQAVTGDAGVVDQNIKTSAALKHRLDQAIHLGFDRNVGLQGVGLAPCRGDGSNHFICCRGGTGVVHNHFCTRFTQGESDGTADATPSSRHQGGLSGKRSAGRHEGTVDRRIVRSHRHPAQPGMLSIVSTASPSNL